MTDTTAKDPQSRIEVCLISADEMKLASQRSARQQNRLTRQGNPMAMNNFNFLTGLPAPAALTVSLWHH
jgi:hypothetical protein